MMTDHRPRVADHANQLNAFGFLRLSGSFFVSFVASAFVGYQPDPGKQIPPNSQTTL
jgi:hypothetical protein